MRKIDSFMVPLLCHNEFLVYTILLVDVYICLYFFAPSFLQEFLQNYFEAIAGY